MCKVKTICTATHILTSSGVLDISLHKNEEGAKHQQVDYPRDIVYTFKKRRRKSEEEERPEYSQLMEKTLNLYYTDLRKDTFGTGKATNQIEEVT